MNDVISRSAAIAAIRSAHPSGKRSTYARLIGQLPALDAAPVVHASWMIHYYDTGTYSFKCVPYNESSFDNPEGILFCSHCDKEALCNGVEEYTPSRYCPGCGARMDGECA